jgi:SPP1 family predicted phage head-tail adaptor
MLAAGRLRHRIEIHDLDDTQNETTGNVEPAWSLFADAWADIRPVSAREFIAAGAEQTAIVVTVRIRKIAGIKRWMRIRHGERLYNVEGVLPDPDSGNEYLTLPCSEVTSE